MPVPADAISERAQDLILPVFGSLFLNLQGAFFASDSVTYSILFWYFRVHLCIGLCLISFPFPHHLVGLSFLSLLLLLLLLLFFFLLPLLTETIRRLVHSRIVMP